MHQHWGGGRIHRNAVELHAAIAIDSCSRNNTGKSFRNVTGEPHIMINVKTSDLNNHLDYPKTLG